MHSRGLGVGALLLALVSIGCSAPDRVGTTQQPFCVGAAIGNVGIDLGTYHFEDPAHLLASAEGFGPRTVSLDVVTSVAPQVSVTVTPSSGTGGAGGAFADALRDEEEMIAGLIAAQFTTTLGYSETDTFSLDAASTVLVPVNGYARLEAYTAYQRATWDVLGFGCAATGEAYKPIGVYFKTCEVVAGCPFLTGPVSAGGPVDVDGGADAGDGG